MTDLTNPERNSRMASEEGAPPQRESTPKDDVLWTVVEAARFLNLEIGSVYHLVSASRVPVIRISSRCIRFSRRALQEWVQSRTEPAAKDENHSRTPRRAGHKY